MIPLSHCPKGKAKSLLSLYARERGKRDDFKRMSFWANWNSSWKTWPSRFWEPGAAHTNWLSPRGSADKVLSDGSLLLCLFSQKPACAFSSEIGNRTAPAAFSPTECSLAVFSQKHTCHRPRDAATQNRLSTCLDSVFCLFKPASLFSR